MKRVSRRAAHYIRDELLRRERFIVIALDSGQKIVSVNRSTPDWSISGLIRGSVLPDSLASLFNTACASTGPMVFPYVELDGSFVDIHVLLGDNGSADLVIHDVSEAHETERVLQQRAHENSLLSEQTAALNSELAELNQELFLRRREAERASAAKSRFIASMSHEFRSPIASIMGYADLLEAELPDSDNPKALRRASWHLLTLVENLLEQARDGQQNISLNPTRFSLDLLADDIEDLFKTQATAKGLRLDVKSAPEDIEVECDELRLRQILINLISNALRYTNEGEVSVDLRHRDDKLYFRVRDSGRGIEAADIDRIFEAFTRVGKGDTSGAGLGLTITRQLVKRMGGRLKVESEPGVGSEFRVVIPCPTPVDGPVTMPQLSGTVLWVDDDQDILSLYQVVLESWGLDVLTASSAGLAMELFNDSNCDLVVTDMHLTDGNGVDLFNALHAQRPGVTGIIISGSGLVDLPAKPGGKGIRTFLQKPIDAEHLYNEIAAVFAGE